MACSVYELHHTRIPKVFDMLICYLFRSLTGSNQLIWYVDCKSTSCCYDNWKKWSTLGNGQNLFSVLLLVPNCRELSILAVPQRKPSCKHFNTKQVGLNGTQLSFFRNLYTHWAFAKESFNVLFIKRTFSNWKFIVVGRKQWKTSGENITFY